MLSNPDGVAVDAAGNVFIADINNQRIRKVAADGTITTFAGTGVAGFGGDGGPAANAQLNMPSRVFVSAAGAVFIADQFNERIRKVTPDGIITTLAGSTQGYCGDGGQAIRACLNGPLDVITDAAGNVFFADSGNNVIRRVDTSGIITTIAGNGTQGYGGDGGAATKATLNGPRGVALSPSGDLYISDAGNNRIRKVSNGQITTVAGTGVAGFTGDGGPGASAEIAASGSLRFDAGGNLYIPVTSSHRVRVLLANGTIYTVAGNGVAGFSGDGGPAISAEIQTGALAITPSGAIYLADASNERIRLLTPVPQPPTIYVSGIVPACSKSTSVQSGSWISIYGTNLAPTPTSWNGDFPTKLGGTTVTIDGKPAYIWFVSPGQINVQAPDDNTFGAVSVVVTTPYGSFSSTVTLAQYAPCFSLLDAIHPAAIVATSGPGNTGLGYDIIGPVGEFSFPTRPLVPGEIVTLFGVGFGATTPSIPAGQIVTAAAPSVVIPQISIGGIPAQVLFAGIVEAGLFQFNVVVPNAPSGDQELLAVVGGVPTPLTTVITMQ
jgi:uncharacterized protein (TIGR03437 family)